MHLMYKGISVSAVVFIASVMIASLSGFRERSLAMVEGVC